MLLIERGVTIVLGYNDDRSAFDWGDSQGDPALNASQKGCPVLIGAHCWARWAARSESPFQHGKTSLEIGKVGKSAGPPLSIETRPWLLLSPLLPPPLSSSFFLLSSSACIGLQQLETFARTLRTFLRFSLDRFSRARNWTIWTPLMQMRRW